MLLSSNEAKFNFQFSWNLKKIKQVKTSEGAKDGEDRDVWSDLPDNLIEVPPVSLQSFMLKYKNKFRGRRGETERKG